MRADDPSAASKWPDARRGAGPGAGTRWPGSPAAAPCERLVRTCSSASSIAATSRAIEKYSIVSPSSVCVCSSGERPTRFSSHSPAREPIYRITDPLSRGRCDVGVAVHKVALWPGRSRSTHKERVASMTGQHIATNARHGLLLTAILGLVLTGTEVQRWR